MEQPPIPVFNAYEIPPPQSRVLTSLYAGRCLSRAYFHMQQAVLLWCGYSNPSLMNTILEAKDQQKQSATRAIVTYSKFIACLEPEARDQWEIERASSDVLQAWHNVLGSGGRAKDEVEEAHRRFLDRNVGTPWDDLTLDVVKACVDPFFQRMHSFPFDRSLRDDKNLRSAFRLGLILEQGLSRSDVHHLLRESRQHLLPERGMTEDELCAFEAECRDSVLGADANDANTVLRKRELAYESHDPGDLRPEGGWFVALQEAWDQAGLGAIEVAEYKYLKQRIEYRQESWRVLRSHFADGITAIHREACLQLLDISSPSETRKPGAAELDTQRDTTGHDKLNGTLTPLTVLDRKDDVQKNGYAGNVLESPASARIPSQDNDCPTDKPLSGCRTRKASLSAGDADASKPFRHPEGATQELPEERSAGPLFNISVPELKPNEYSDLLKLKNEMCGDRKYIGSSVAILRVFERISDLNAIRKVNKPNQKHPSVHAIPPVLILGPSGTGKTELAQIIHESCEPTKGKPVSSFISSDIEGGDPQLIKYQWSGYGPKCGLPNTDPNGSLGFIHTHDGGSIFLDEVHDCPDWFQTYLFQVLDGIPMKAAYGEEQSFSPNVRMIFASNWTLAALTEKLKHDFMKRIGDTRVLEIPPLRNRKEDIIEFVNAWLTECKFDSGFLLALLLHDWPGEVRSLRDVLSEVTVAAKKHQGRLKAEHLPIPGEIRNRVTNMTKVRIDAEIYRLLASIYVRQGYTKRGRGGRGLHDRIATTMRVSKWTVTRMSNAARTELGYAC